MECVGVSEASGGGKSEGERATGGGASRWSAWGKRREWEVGRLKGSGQLGVGRVDGVRGGKRGEWGWEE